MRIETNMGSSLPLQQVNNLIINRLFGILRKHFTYPVPTLAATP